jgi:hypothetical protein
VGPRRPVWAFGFGAIVAAVALAVIATSSSLRVARALTSAT